MKKKRANSAPVDPVVISSFDKDILVSVKENHIWLNAFKCIRPTVDFRLKLADTILHWLDDEHYFIYDHQDSKNKALRDLGRLTPQIVIRINKS